MVKTYIRWVQRFMSAGRYRLLTFLLFGAFWLSVGTWWQWDELRSDRGTTILVFSVIAFYLTCSGIYGYLIYTDRWKTAFWDVITEYQKQLEDKSRRL